MSHGRRREYQAFFCKILCRLVTPRHASAHANHHNISLDLLAAASRGTGASRRGQAARRSVRRVQMSLKAATSASRCVLGYRRSDVSSQRMAASGHGPPVSPTPAGGRFGSNLAARYQSRERPESVLPADRSTSREGLDFDESTAVDPIQKPAARAIPPQAVIRPQYQRS